MKTGAIVYMLNKNFNADREPYIIAAIKKSHNAEIVEVVSHGQAHFDVMDAWWRLTAKGAQKFVCLFAIDRGGNFKPAVKRHLQLCK